MPEREKSDAWHMIELLGKQNKRMFCLAMALLVAWLVSDGYCGRAGYIRFDRQAAHYLHHQQNGELHHAHQKNDP